MKAVTINLIAIATLVLAGNANASGFKCEGKGYNVKLYNKTVGGTRIPSKFILSHVDADPRTLLTRSEGQIRKHNNANTVQYVVNGNSTVGAETVILQISFKEGLETLEAGEEVPGQLILVEEDGSREVTRLSCERYLKGE